LCREKFSRDHAQTLSRERSSARFGAPIASGAFTGAIGSDIDVFNRAARFAAIEKYA